MQDRKTKVGTGIRLCLASRESSQSLVPALLSPASSSAWDRPSAFTGWGQRSCPVCSEEISASMAQLLWGQWSFLSFCPTLTGLPVLNASLPRGCRWGPDWRRLIGRDDAVLRAVTQCPLQGRGETKTQVLQQSRWEGTSCQSHSAVTTRHFRKTLWAEYVLVEESYLYETISPMIIKAVQIQ